MKRCQKCGSTFLCEGEGDCWCEEAKIHKAQMLEILESYTDCICPSCLKEYEAQQ
jgi:hypothetical protein